MKPKHVWRLIVHDPSRNYIGLVSRVIYEFQERWEETCRVELTSDFEALRHYLAEDSISLHAVIELVSKPDDFKAGRTDLHVSILPETVLAIQITRRGRNNLIARNTSTYEAANYEGEDCVRELVYWVRNQLIEHASLSSEGAPLLS